MKSPSLALALMIVPALVHADYLAIGEIEGQVCTGFFIEKCEVVLIHAVERDGQLHHIARRYAEVSEYRDGRCWITVESRGTGIISGAINALLVSDFYTRTADGQYKEVDPEYLTFLCRVE